MSSNISFANVMGDYTFKEIGINLKSALLNKIGSYPK